MSRRQATVSVWRSTRSKISILGIRRIMGGVLSIPVDILFLLCIMDTAIVLGLTKLIGAIEPISLVARSECWNTPGWLVVWKCGGADLREAIDVLT